MSNESNDIFLAWYKDYHEAFIRYCSTIAYGHVSAEDLAQEAILATLQNFDAIKNQSKLFSYMVGIVRNKVRNQQRRKKFHAAWNDELLNYLKSSTSSPEIAMDIHIMLQYIERLPLQQKEALLLFEISGFSIKEISDIQDSSIGATKTRISRSRKKLKTLLSDEKASTSISERLLILSSIIF